MGRKLILIADEDSEVLGLLKRRLSSAGHAIETVRDGDRAVAAIESNKPDLVILEVILPGLNGYQVCRKIRDTPEIQSLPVIFLTNKSEPADRFWANELGARAFIVKPFDLRALVNKVQAIFQEDNDDP